jgi:hypothetical protein
MSSIAETLLAHARVGAVLGHFKVSLLAARRIATDSQLRLSSRSLNDTSA